MSKEQGQIIIITRKIPIDKNGMAERQEECAALDRTITGLTQERSDINATLKKHRKRLSEILQESANKIHVVEEQVRAVPDYDNSKCQILNAETGEFIEEREIDKELSEKLQQMTIPGTEPETKKKRGRRSKGMELNTGDHSDADAAEEWVEQ